MINITPQEKIKLIRLYETNPELAFIKVVDLIQGELSSTLKQEIDRNMAEIARPLLTEFVKNLKGEEVVKLLSKNQPFIEATRGQKGDPGPKPVAGVDYQVPKDGKDGKDGEGKDGEDADPEEVAHILKSDPSFVSKLKGERGDDGSQDKPIEIANKLNTLTGKVDMKVIRGLNKYLASLEKLVRQRRSAGSAGGASGGGGDSMNFYDLSSQTNGVLKTFSVPRGRKVIVLGSDFPSVLMEGNGFTMNAARTLLTLTVVNAPSSGSQLLYQYTR